MKLKHSLMLCFLLAVSTAFSQAVTVNKINERRSTSDGYFDNRCEIELKVTGDEVRKSKFVRLSAIATITDDQGLNLTKDDNEFKYKEIDSDVKISIETKVPSRKATVIKEIAGEMILYNPTDANGAIVKVADYQKKTNVNLLPSTAGVQVVYLTKESVEKYAAEQKLKKQDEINKLPEPAKKIAEEILRVFEGFATISNDASEPTFLIQGDQSKFVDLYFEDENGQKIKRSGYAQMNNLVTYSFRQAPKPGWKLVLNIETAGSIKKIPFKLTDIALP